MNTNLVYVFLPNYFNQPVNFPQSWCSYSEMPGYYVDTFKFNSVKFTQSWIITDSKQIDIYRTLFPDSCPICPALFANAALGGRLEAH